MKASTQRLCTRSTCKSSSKVRKYHGVRMVVCHVILLGGCYYRLVLGYRTGDAPIFEYLAWQAVHEPMDAPASYIAPYQNTLDDSRRIYAGMVAVMDEGIGNITATLKEKGLYNDSVLVLSNDNGGMSGTYGLGCCNCGTSCGGLNYPYRGWKDSMWEG
eukprot:SAG31_NODE_480_length_15108_cov_56.073423_13_plen_159_part_00